MCSSYALLPLELHGQRLINTLTEYYTADSQIKQSHSETTELALSKRQKNPRTCIENMTGVKDTRVYFETACSDILTNKS